MNPGLDGTSSPRFVTLIATAAVEKLGAIPKAGRIARKSPVSRTHTSSE